MDGAFQYLGGLDRRVDDGDMLWFGVTERMQDIMCLLLNYNIMKQKFWIGIEMKHPRC
jgi:hypothetical protein